MDVIQDPKELEPILLKYFGSIKVQIGQKVLLPKKNYLESIFSNTKLFIMAETENKIDISSKYAFPLLENLMKSLHSSTRGAWSLLKQVQSHIGLTITMDPSDESA